MFLLAMLFAATMAAQAPVSSFDVASIKPGDPDNRQVQIRMTPNGFIATNAPLKMLIQYAYNLKSEDQLSGLPASLSSKGFDIDAKEDEALAAELQNLPVDQRASRVQSLLQRLLADRFKLQVDRQVKQLPIYALVVSSSGVKMIPEAKVPPPADAAAPKPRRTLSKRGQITGNGVPVSTLADMLSRQPEIGGRIVADKTGLPGNYYFDLKWTPESPAAASSAAPADDPAPSFFTAIQEQLGLKLEPQKGPVEVVVVEHVEAPLAD